MYLKISIYGYKYIDSFIKKLIFEFLIFWATHLVLTVRLLNI